MSMLVRGCVGSSFLGNDSQNSFGGLALWLFKTGSSGHYLGLIFTAGLGGNLMSPVKWSQVFTLSQSEAKPRSVLLVLLPTKRILINAQNRATTV